MHKSHALSLGILLGLGAAASGWAVPQAASPFDEAIPLAIAGKGDAPAIDAFGDPGDFTAAAAAAADYLVHMQADMSEDNAGNGNPDVDLEDGGWDWATTAFQHSSSSSATNLYGVTANGLYRNYLADPRAAWFTAMQDAADNIISRGPTVVRSASDILFLMNFASLSGVADPAFYRNSALAIWNGRMAVYGNPTALGQYIRNARAGQGLANGIIPWDVSAWAKAAAALNEAFPGLGYDVAATDFAEVLWQDSYMGNLGYFDPDGASQGYDPAGNTSAYWYYTLGITGLIDAFTLSSDPDHLAAIAGLETLLLDCQTADGAFSDQYGGHDDDATWQATAYALATLGDCLPGNDAALNSGCLWLAATQHSSGGFVYGSGNHYPEVGGECAAGLSYGLPYTVVQSPLYTHIAENNGDPYVDQAALHYALVGGAEPFRAVTVFIGYDDDVLALDSLHFDPLWHPADGTFQYNLTTNPIEVSLVILGYTEGITGPLDLFDLHFNGISDGIADDSTLVEITLVVMRDPENQNIYVEAGDDAVIVVDDEAPALDATTTAPACINGDFWAHLVATENIDLDRIMYSFDGGAHWTNTLLAMSGTGFTGDFLVPASTLPEGDYTVLFEVWDAVGYSSTDAIDFHLDPANPVAPTGLVAMPRDHAVLLTWSDDGGVSFDSLQVWRAKRATNYPYPLPAGRPDPATWPTGFARIGSLLGGVQTYTDLFPSDDFDTRGIYDYVLVAKDCVNDSTASAPASATNYYLGDWADITGYSEPYDGSVCIYDLNHDLANEYGNDANAGNNEMDIAPTHNMGRFGLPGPDGRINFEDLIILAMNYRVCGTSPLLIIRRGESAGQVVDDAASLTLSGTGSERQLLLDGSLLGLTAELSTTAELLSASSTHGTVLFYRSTGGWTVDVVGLADLLGPDTVISLVFAGDAQVSLSSAEGRDEENTMLPLMETTLEGPAQPAVFALGQNHPNPFNPMTTIHYSLAVAGPARLAVYNSLGQQVALLQDGHQSAGAHELSFDGSVLASGVYIYRLEANGSVAQQKMILVK